jgi:hypothetical protein
MVIKLNTCTENRLFKQYKMNKYTQNIQMKYYVLSLMIVTSFVTLFSSCENNDEITTPDFEVTTEKVSYKVGDTIQFNFTGKADVLTFYSGELGSNYEAKDRYTAEGVVKLAFELAMTEGLPPAVSLDAMSVLISIDLAGYDAESIAKATWTDITSRNTKWPTAKTSTYTKSDAIDISDFSSANKINIAFKYVGKPNPASRQSKWQIKDLTLNNTLADGTVTPLFSTFTNVGWVQASIKNDLNKGTPTSTGYNAWDVGTWNVSATNNPIIFSTASGLKAVNTNGIVMRTEYPITFDPGTTVNNDENEDWLITSAIDLKKIKPGGNVIKSAINKSLTKYQYIYKNAGTYKVTFDAMNNNLDHSIHSVKQIEITVVP